MALVLERRAAKLLGVQLRGWVLPPARRVPMGWPHAAGSLNAAPQNWDGQAEFGLWPAALRALRVA